MRRTGMTLLELVLALALSGVVVGGSLAFYRQAVQVRSRMQERAGAIESVRLIMDRLTNELRQAYRLRIMENQGQGVDLGLNGTSYQLEFIRTMIPGPSVWVERKITEAPIPAEFDLERVTYRLGVAEDPESGEQVLAGLERVYEKRFNVQVIDTETLESSILSPKIGFVYFVYWNNGAPVESWAGGDLPQAVEVTLGFTPLPENVAPADYPYEKFHRLIYLPGGE